jgi:molybdopterin-guanine dinucleotide biosynthesis protein A
MTQFGFVLGNGKTRKQVNPAHLKSVGSLYVCNRAAEEMSHDVCVAVDKEIAIELQKQGHVVYTRSNALRTENARLIQKNIGWSSGPVAATIAAMNGHAYIFLIGMDLISDTKNINNLYADTKHYKTYDSAPTPHGNWVGQIDTLLREYTSQRFIHVNPLQNYTPEQWARHKNFQIMTLAQFETMINNTTE